MSRMPSRSSALLLPEVIDSLVALALVVGAVCVNHEGRILEDGLAPFLSIRITALNVSFCFVFAVIWNQCLESLGLFQGDFKKFSSLIIRVTLACLTMTGLLALYLELRQAKGPIVLVLISFLVLALTWELCRVMLINRQLWRSPEPCRVVILGSGRRASKAWRELRIRYPYQKCFLGFVDDRDPAAMPPDIASRFLSDIETFDDYLLRNVVDELIIATPLRSCYDLTQRAVSIAEAAGVRLISVGEPFRMRFAHKRIDAPLFVDLQPDHHLREAAETVKRIFDFAAAAAALVLMLPLFLLICVAIKLTSPGSVLFAEPRYGAGRRLFNMVKFRIKQTTAQDSQKSFNSQNEGQENTTTIDQQNTPLGGFLRRTSLDCLPQLWNVLIGDMSLVGPQPMSASDVFLFSDVQFLRRFKVRPGITGSWQVTGNSSSTSDHSLMYDLSYVDERSLALDLKILARTLPLVLQRFATV